jgi:hypothetical protein
LNIVSRRELLAVRLEALFFPPEIRNCFLKSFKSIGIYLKTLKNKGIPI